MSSLLAEMTQLSLARVEEARSHESEQDLWARVCAAPPPPHLKLSPEGFDVIAEYKLHSPSAGDLSGHTNDIETRVTAYGQGGACAVSVLTEPKRFGGTLLHLEQAAKVLAPLKVPAMRKDFLVDPYQVMEARAAGAGGVLVIVRMLDRSRITALLDSAAMLKMFALIETFDAADLEVTREVLAARKSHVAESGVHSNESVKAVVDQGYHVALVGTTLMNSSDPRRLLGEMLAAGRE